MAKTSRYVRIDCAKRTGDEALAELVRRVRPTRSGVVIVVDRLLALEGSVVAFLKGVLRHVTECGVHASIVDGSGCAATFLGAFGGEEPLSALSAGSPAQNPRRILAVEDHEDSLEFLRTLVESAGQVCVPARSVKEAIRRLDTGGFDLVLLDMVLPDADGIEVAEHIQRSKMSVPVVAVSAYLDRWDAKTYARLGIRRRIAKPYRVKEILEAVRGE